MLCKDPDKAIPCGVKAKVNKEVHQVMFVVKQILGEVGENCAYLRSKIEGLEDYENKQ
ncbi:hypothetical protein J6590_029150, partial [Homalodisca vitripennis]